jgi:hypothetical protein
MSSPMTAQAILDRVYLDVRCKLLDVAASLDRLDRAQGTEALAGDARLSEIARGIEILAQGGDDRAERIQMLFSDPYLANWNRQNKSTGHGATPR